MFLPRQKEEGACKLLSDSSLDVKTPHKPIDPDTVATVQRGKSKKHKDPLDIAEHKGEDKLEEVEEEEHAAVPASLLDSSCNDELSNDPFSDLPHILEKLPKADSLCHFDGGPGEERGIFNFLGKKAVKFGVIEVTSSGYDAAFRRPEDMLAGKKSGDGCVAVPE